MKKLITIIVGVVSVAMTGAVWAETIPARVDWAQRLEMVLEQSGKIEQISVRTGDQVKAGEEILRLDPTPFTSEVSQAQARLQKAQAELNDLEQELGRSRELYDRGVLATVPLQRSELEVTRAKSEFLAAQAALQAAQYRLAGSRIEAPFDAWVIRRNASVGQVVNSALQPPVLMVIGQAGTYVARAMVDAATAERIAQATTVSVRLGTQDYSAKLRSVALEPDAQSRYAVEAEFQISTRPQIGATADLVLP